MLSKLIKCFRAEDLNLYIAYLINFIIIYLYILLCAVTGVAFVAIRNSSVGACPIKIYQPSALIFLFV